MRQLWLSLLALILTATIVQAAGRRGTGKPPLGLNKNPAFLDPGIMERQRTRQQMQLQMMEQLRARQQQMQLQRQDQQQMQLQRREQKRRSRTLFEQHFLQQE